jgi:hypothetical protein
MFSNCQGNFKHISSASTGKVFQKLSKKKQIRIRLGVE